MIQRRMRFAILLSGEASLLRIVTAILQETNQLNAWQR
jgi:hypothetical protein